MKKLRIGISSLYQYKRQYFVHLGLKVMKVKSFFVNGFKWSFLVYATPFRPF